MNYPNKKRLLTSAALSLLMLGLPKPLHAESLDTIQTHALEAVVIRSYIPQRPTAPSIGQPTSLTWITPKALEQYRIQSLTDLTSRVPSLFIPDYGSKRSSAIYLRGSGARSAGQTIGLYVDGVPVLNKSGFNFELPGLAGIEVLRGPQGSLYGRNAMSGIINYYTRSAFEHTGGQASLTAGSHRLLRASVEQSLLLNPKLGLNYGLSGTTRRGYFYNETHRAYQDSLRQISAFTKLEYRPSDRLEMALSLTGDYVRQGGFPYRTDDPVTKRLAPLNAGDEETYERHSFAARHLLSYKWGRVQLQSATGYQYLYDRTAMDMDAMPVYLFRVTQGLRQHGFTQEFILKGLRERSQKYAWSLGLFGYYDAKHIEAPVHMSYRGIKSMIDSQLARLHQRSPQAPKITYNDPQAKDVTNLNDFRMPDWGLALYHESAYELAPAWTVTAGLRLDYEHHLVRYDSRGYEMPLTITLPDGREMNVRGKAALLQGKQSVDYWHVIPKFSLAWKPSEALHAYATVTRGLKTGGFNEQSFSDLITTVQGHNVQAMSGRTPAFDESTIPERTTYKPEHSWNYELGARYHQASWGLELSASAYYMHVKDLQLTRFVSSGAGRVVGNAGASRTWGLELAASQRIYSSLRAQLSYSLTDARFSEDYTGGKKGDFVPFIPRHIFSAMLSGNEYLTSKLRLFGEVEWSGLGELYWREDNSQRENLQTTLRARLGLGYQRYAVSLWGGNLLNNSYTIFQAASPLGRLVQTSAPRTLGVDLTVRF